MLTKQDLTDALKTTEERLTTKIEASRKGLHEEIENAVAQIARATVKALENVATKDDLKADSPTAREFADHEKRISRLEKTAFPSN